MKPTTKMFVAQAARKRDSRGRFTSEGEMGGYMNGGGNMRMQGGGNMEMRGGNAEMRRGGGGSRNGGYRMGEERMYSGNSGSMRSRDESRNYGENRRGGSRGRMMDDGGDEEKEMYGNGATYAGNPMPNFNTPEGRDIEHGKQRPSNRYDMGDDEPRIGFRDWPEMGGGGSHDNVVSMKRGRSSMHNQEDDEEFTPELAEKWVKAMKNEDGTKGPHWTKEQTNQVMKHMGVQGIEPHEFYAIMNAMYSDYCAVAKKFGVDATEFYGALAKAWLMDEDAVEDKAKAYYCYVVEH